MYRIRTYTPDDREPLLNDVIGPHQRSPEEYTLTLDDDTVHAYVATDNEMPVGVMALDVRTLETLHEACAVIDESLTSNIDFPATQPIGFVKAGYTSPAYTGQGIGSALLQTIESVAGLNRLPRLFTEAWVHGGEDSPDRLLEGAGYTAVGLPDNIVEKDWVQDTDACVKCQGECTCRAVLYQKRLGN